VSRYVELRIRAEISSVRALQQGARSPIVAPPGQSDLVNRRKTFQEWLKSGRPFCEGRGANWLLDEIAFTQRGDKRVTGEESQLYKLMIDPEHAAMLTCEAHSGNVQLVRSISSQDRLRNAPRTTRSETEALEVISGNRRTAFKDVPAVTEAVPGQTADS
jgi:hypothetical protein